LTWKIVLAFLDDILVLGATFDDHMRNLREVFARFRENGVKLKTRKCEFFQKRVEFLGRWVGKDSLEMSNQDIEVVREWPVPTCTRDVERFLGLANYHRGFVKGFAEIATPLYAVTGKKAFKWEPDQQNAFDRLKRALTNPPVLALPRSGGEFILDTDASETAIGAELLQIQDGCEKVVAYGSLALTKEQRRYCTTRKELLAVVRFTREYRHYLLGRPFVVRTDHNSLTWLMRFKDPQGQLARWIEELSQYTMVVKHRPGRLHANADALSRAPFPETCPLYRLGVKLDDLPCFPCVYCERADRKWARFVEEVDDVVQLPTPGRVPGGEESEAWNNEGSGLGPDSALEVLADEVYQIRE
jgi:hypothetical protein